MTISSRFPLFNVAATSCAVGALAVVASLVMDASGASPRHMAVRVECATAAVCDRAEALALDVWSDHRGPGDPLDIVVPASALDALRATGAEFAVIDNDIDATARAERERIQVSARPGDDWFTEFHDYSAIEARIRELAELAPARAAVHDIGRTFDGRTIWALHVSASHDDAVPMLVNGTLHAREWISAMSATCIADRLVREADSDPAIRAFVETTDVWIVPVANPDGYQYSWDEQRYWRKNRRGGFGVDLNRNFSVGFGGSGSSGLKRSDNYRGEEPFSENETAALRALVQREEIRLHVDLHAYGQLVLFPWTHSRTPTDDHARLGAIGDDLSGAIYATHNNRYRLMRGVDLYPAAGTMTDWMYGDSSAISFTIELRPRSGGGFVLPPTEIRPTCDEALAAVLALRASRHIKAADDAR